MTVGGALEAAVDDAGDFAAEVFAVADHVDEVALEHELGGLEALGRLDFARLTVRVAKP